MSTSKSLNLQLPFNGSWFVHWGGDTPELNGHRRPRDKKNPRLISQRYAFDIVKTSADGSTDTGKKEKNTDYATFGEPIIAPEDGLVVEAVDGVRDNIPEQTTNIYVVPGNHVLIKHTEGLYSIICHFQQGTVAVKSGDKVTRGQFLGKAGNSGNSTEPHVHYHLQSQADFAAWRQPNYKLKPVAKGLKVYFSDILVTRDGKTMRKKYYSPIKGDIVSNPDQLATPA